MPEPMHQGDEDPLVIDDAVMQQGPADGQYHADLAGPDAVAGGLGRAHPSQRKNEEDAGDQVNDFDDVLAACELCGHGFVGRLDLNILSMRSVIRNPPTTLLVAAMTGEHAQDEREIALVFTHQHDGPDHGDGVQARWSATSAACAAAARPA